MQMPEEEPASSDMEVNRFVYLMAFKDGNRIDLTLVPLERREQLFQPDSLSVVLLDKDGLLAAVPPASDRDYLIEKPSEKEFDEACNEFWWICTYIAKGLWREELPYVMYMYEQINRNVLIRMLEWQIGIRTDFSVSTGSFGKYLQDFLTAEEWKTFTVTYTDGNHQNIWQGLFCMCDLFRASAIRVAEHFGFRYPHQDDSNVTAHLRHVRKLARDAGEMYWN